MLSTADLRDLLAAVREGDISAAASLRNLLAAREACDEGGASQDQYMAIIQELVGALSGPRPPNAVLFALDGAYSVTALPAVLSFIDRALADLPAPGSDGLTALLNALNIAAKMREVALGGYAEALLRRAALADDPTVSEWAKDLLSVDP